MNNDCDIKRFFKGGQAVWSFLCKVLFFFNNTFFYNLFKVLTQLVNYLLAKKLSSDVLYGSISTSYEKHALKFVVLARLCTIFESNQECANGYILLMLNKSNIVASLIILPYQS